MWLGHHDLSPGKVFSDLKYCTVKAIGWFILFIQLYGCYPNDSLLFSLLRVVYNDEIIGLIIQFIT